MVDNNKKRTEKKGPARKKSFGRAFGTVVLWLFVMGLMVVMFAGGAVAGYVTSIVKDEPVRSREMIVQKVSEDAITGFAYFQDGTPIGQIRTEEDRRPIEYEQIPSLVIDAVLAIEDNNFNEHKGVDMNGTLRAVKQKVLNESVQTGGSTLTQQLVRRVFLNLDKTEDRKIKEILLSLRIERFLTKKQILTAYLNKVPFGNGSSGYNVFGIKAAAKGIFNINDLNELNVAQAAYLAGLPQLPSVYSAYNGKGEFVEDNFNRAMDRQALVLRRMLEEGKINTAQYEEAKAFDLKASLAKTTAKAYSTYPYLMMETERQAAEILAKVNQIGGEGADTASNEVIAEAKQQLTTGGYKVYTTIDKIVYNTMQKIAKDDSNFYPDSEAKGMERTAAMMIDNKTGAILGMIEGRDFYEEQMNYATQMIRQPGSTMKPIAAYLPAIESGAIQPASILDDAPIILKDYQKGFHIPENSSGGYEGLMTARKALNKSKNTIALKLFNEVVGIDNSWAFAKKLGITTINESDYSATTGVLGGLKYGVSVEELTNAYSAIANQGQFNDAYMIDKIVDSKGKIIYKHQHEPVQAFSEQTAYLMTDMMRTVITEGTADKVRSNYKHFGDIPIVGKTGSTQNYADVWFMGYSPDVTVGVWVGYKEQINALVGDQRKHAQTIWTQIMNNVITAKPELFSTKKFEQPSGITSKTVSAYSGKLPTSLTNKFVTDLFNVKYVPTDSDDGVAMAKYITYNGANYIPQDGTPEDFLKEKIVVKREKPIHELVKELEAAFKGMKGGHKALNYYLPKDATTDMPTEVDPRQEDGRSPDAPQNVRYANENGTAVISFNKSPQADVIGYRLYRAYNGGLFQYQGNVVLSGDATVFNYSMSAGGLYYFYVTAVDVSGNESDPSLVVGSLDGLSPGEQGPEDDLGDPLEGEDGYEEDWGDWGGIDDVIDLPAPTDPQEPAAAPAAPTQPQLKRIDNGISFQWSGGDDQAIQYNIYYSDSQGGSYNKIGSSNRSEYVYVTSAPTKGWFRITAVNEAGESAPSPATYFE